MMRFLDSLSWPVLAFVTIFLGLAPFVPEPHVWEKLKMLAAGELTQAIDIFDFLMHGAPFVLLGLKGVREVRKAQSGE
ncbi:MAG: hypothetical protein HLUCCO07_01055 [Rhodobacteraceae bacterium HLUCCO07]|nr:MAG: hypothetical protein HLUCCO07_01055 [Rhodobacteraceae bacterium HLUCCO07]